MLNYQIKTYKVGRNYDLPHFFVLNKGLNSGRPMNNPCPNCFVIMTTSEKHRESLFYLCLSLQIGRYFGYYLKGSIVPFIAINDASKVIKTGLIDYQKNNWQLKILKLKKIIVYQENLRKQIEAIEQLKLVLIKR